VDRARFGASLLAMGVETFLEAWNMRCPITQEIKYAERTFNHRTLAGFFP
jgi:hypothetical protein